MPSVSSSSLDPKKQKTNPDNVTEQLKWVLLLTDIKLKGKLSLYQTYERDEKEGDWTTPIPLIVEVKPSVK